MNAANVVATIQTILAPVVMVSACAILVSGMLNRYAAINDRMRALNRERFELLRSAAPDPNTLPTALDFFTAERLRQIDHQLPELLHRHRLVHNAVLALYYAIALFIADMFVIAVAANSRSTAASDLVLGLFLLSTAVMLIAVVTTAREVRTSQRAVEYEVKEMGRLGRREPPSP